MNLLLRKLSNKIKRLEKRVYKKIFRPKRPSWFSNPCDSASEIMTILLTAAYENIKDLNEDKVDWEQILELRQDKEALQHYRCLRNLATKSAEITGTSSLDTIAKNIDNYEWALKKHGIETITSVISVVTNKSTLISSAVAGAVGATVGNYIIGALLSGVPIAAEVILKIVERRVMFEDFKRTGKDGEVAILYDIKKRLHNDRILG